MDAIEEFLEDVAEGDPVDAVEDAIEEMTGVDIELD